MHPSPSRPGDWLSVYDETKYLAHEAAKERAQKGAPIVMVQPGGVYGPGDHPTRLVPVVHAVVLQRPLRGSAGPCISHRMSAAPVAPAERRR